MTDYAAPPASFRRIGPPSPAGPVMLAVPHAGRDYPASLLAAAALPREALERLEDRHADALIAGATDAGAIAIVADRARAWIDLNRDEREVDPAMIAPQQPAHTLLSTPKTRAGIGLIPRRAGGRDILRRPIAPAALEARIAEHRTYHAAIASALDATVARFGVALLLDCHSMPPLAPSGREPPPQVVIGDRFGRSAAASLVDQLSALFEGAGLRVAHNAPYAGGHGIDRHGRPDAARHAIQIEIDRSLYLRADLRTPGPGLAPLQRLFADAVESLGQALMPGAALAAE